MSSLPCFLRRGNRRKWFCLCRHFFAITINALNIKMFYDWGFMFTIAYMYSVFHQCIDCFTLLSWKGEQEELISFVQAFLCHNYNCLPFQNVPDLWFYVHYSIYVLCISCLFWLVYLVSLVGGKGRVGFLCVGIPLQLS